MSRHRPSRLLAAALMAAVAATTVPPAAPASAHEGRGIVDVEAAHPSGASVHYIVRVTWEDDGHPADDATVTAAASSADGTTLTPVALAPADDDGRYEGVVDFPEPGTWTVRFTSVEPTGTSEHLQEVTGPATGDDEAPTTTAAPSDDTVAAATGEGGGGDDGLPVWLIVAAAVVAVAGVIGALRIVRRERGTPSDRS